MPKGKTGEPRGRRPKVRDELRLVMDAIAIGLSVVLPDLSNTNVARLANRLADPLTETHGENRNAAIRTVMDWQPRSGSASNIDRYTQTRLSGTNSNAASGYREDEVKRVHMTAGLVSLLIGAKNRSTAEAAGDQLIAWGWQKPIVERLLDHALLLNVSNLEYLRPARRT